MPSTTRKSRSRKRMLRSRYGYYDWPESPQRPTSREIIKEEEQYASFVETSDGVAKLMYLCHQCNKHFERIKDGSVNWNRRINTFTCPPCHLEAQMDSGKAYELFSEFFYKKEKKLSNVVDTDEPSYVVAQKLKCTQCGKEYHIDGEPEDYDPWASQLKFCDPCIYQRMIMSIIRGNTKKLAYPWN